MADKTTYHQSLVDAFIKCHTNDYQDETIYQEFITEAKKYVGKPKGKMQYSEEHMICILVSQLASSFFRGNIKSST